MYVMVIVALSETRLIIDIEDFKVNVPGYSMIRCDAENRNIGGTVLYVRDDIRYENYKLTVYILQ